MQPAAVVGAVIAAAIGAGIWALIAATTGYEVGYVAWGVGALVGFGTYRCGGRGQTSGILAAALTVVAILGGKAIGNEFYLEQTVLEQFDEEQYASCMSDAEAYPGAQKRGQLRLFVVDRGYLEAPVDDASLDQFVMVWDEQLSRWNASPPTLEAWQTEVVAEQKAFILSQISRIGLLQESLTLFDVVFAFLGISTAFRIASRVNPTPVESRKTADEREPVEV